MEGSKTQLNFPRRFVFSKASKAMVVFQVATWLAVGLNIPVLRQILGFFYVSFIPGLVILKSLKINQRSVIHIAVFSVCLSLAFVMFVGLLLNWVLPLIGSFRPLTTFNLVVVITILEFVLLLTGKLNPSMDSLLEKPKFEGSKSLWLLVSIIVCSILGAIFVCYYANNLLLLFTFVMICILFLLSTFGRISSRFYPLVIVVVAVALLLQTTLAARYLNGWDIHQEYYLAQITQRSQYWDYSFMSQQAGPSLYNSMLSITILPTIYSNVLNMDIFYVYTIIYPLLFSLVPLALYKIYEGQFGSRTAFWSAFFFMSFSPFYVTMTYLAKQMIAELFFVLIFLLLLESGTKRRSRSTYLMLVVFAFGIVVSHYSTAFISLFYLFFFSLVLMRKSTIQSGRLYVFLITSMVFSWYIFVSNSIPLAALVNFGTSISSSLQNYFVSQYSNPVVLTLAGVGTTSLVSQISRIVFILTTALMIVGVLKSFFAREDVTFSKEFFAVSVGGTLLILACVVVPNFAGGLTVSRTYELGLFFTAPFLVVGSEFIFRCVTKLKRSLPKLRLTELPWANIKIGSVLMSALLITYFLFQSGVVNELTGATPTNLSLTIDKGRIVRVGNIGLFNSFTFEGDVFSARWLANHVFLGSNHTVFGPSLFSDAASAVLVLASYGMMNPTSIRFLSNSTFVPEGSCIYLRNLNYVYGLFQGPGGVFHNITEYSNTLQFTDTIYSNGESAVLWSPMDIVPQY